jgi:hypothetical protein
MSLAEQSNIADLTDWRCSGYLSACTYEAMDMYWLLSATELAL